MTITETIDPKATSLGEDGMVSEARWTEIQRRREAGGVGGRRVVGHPTGEAWRLLELTPRPEERHGR